MASKYDPYRKKMGLKISSSSSVSTRNPKSKYAKEREEIFNPSEPAIQPIRPQVMNNVQNFLKGDSVEKFTKRLSTTPKDTGERLLPFTPGIKPEDVKDKKVQKEISKHKPFQGTKKSLADRAMKNASDFTINAIDEAALGIPEAVLGDNGINSTAGKIGNVAGTLAGFGKAYQLTRGIANTAIKKGLGNQIEKELATVGIHSPKAARELVRGGIAGGSFSTAQQLADAALDTQKDGSQAFGERARKVGLDTVLGGVGDAALPVIGQLAKRGASASANATRGVFSRLNRPESDSMNVAERQTIQPEKPQQVIEQQTVKPEEPATVEIANFSKPSEPESIKLSWFERLFDSRGVGITPFGSNKSNRMVTTEQQIVDSPLKSNVVGALETAKQAARTGYQNTIDYLSPLKTINRETYNTAMDASRANNIANTIIRDKFVDNQGNVIGNSLNDIMKQTRGLGKKFDNYLILRHAITRMERGERVYDEALKMTPDKAMALVAEAEKRFPGIKQLGEEWDKFHENMLDSGVREGLITQAQRDTMRSENPHYASMRRQFTLGERLAQPKLGSGGSSFSGRRAPIKEVSPTGSTRKIVSPIRSAIEQTYAWKNAELRNRTMQEIVKAIQLDPEGMKGIAEIVKVPSTSYKSLDQALRDGGSEEFLELLDNDFKSLFKKNITGEENVVRGMVKGTPVFVKVHNPEAVKALLGLGNEQAGIVLQTFQMLSNATKRGATGLLAPMFAVKSLTGDTIQAAIQSPSSFKHVAVDLPHAFISSIGDMLRIPGLKNLAEDFRRSGGEYSALLRGERELKTTVSNLRREPFLSPKGIAKGAWIATKAPFKALEKVADASENMNRMAAFRRAMLGKERTPENVRNAINAARESTVNFSRKGAFAKETESFIPYSNAAIQGMYRISKAFIKNPVKTLAGLGTLIIGPKLYEYAKFNDDPDYQKLPAREKYRNLIISKNADGTFNKQYMPPEYLAFGAFLTDVLNDVINKDPQAYKGTLSAIVNAFTPPVVSGLAQGVTQEGGVSQSLVGGLNATVLAPTVAIAGNQSFTGAPIVPQRLEDRSIKNQFDERTSSPAKWIGKKIGLAPLKVDYLLRAYGGDPARLILPLTVDAGNTRNTLLRNFIVDPVFTNNLADDFYSAKEKFTNARADNLDVGDPLPKWYSDELYKLVNSRAKGSASTRLTDLNAAKREINGNRSLTGKQKAEQLRDIQAQINEIYLDVNSQLEKAGVPFPNR